MHKVLRVCLVIVCSTALNFAWADSRVFSLNTPNTQQVVDALQQRYGDKLQVELVQEKLVVVGSKQQLDEVSALLPRLDPAPAPLRLRLREQPPEDGQANVVTYSSNSGGGYMLDTVEGAFVSIDYSKIAQQVDAAGSAGNYGGWWITIDNAPTEIRSLTLQVHLQNNRIAIATVSYTREENQERRVYGNTVSGYLGSWIPLLPQPETEPGAISSGPKPGSQLYLRVDKNLANKALR